MFEYVIFHELAHLIDTNHSKEFLSLSYLLYE
ncbi:YgjP-like metallopeptidase domain-containing protein [Helicobacter sp. WB40]